MRDRSWWTLGLTLAALAGATLPAGAATLSGLAIAKNAGNTADFFDDVGAEASAAQSTTSVVSSSASAFETRFAAVVSADRGASGGSGTTVQSFTGDFTITFSVTETVGVGWLLSLDVLRIGSQTLVSDGSGWGSVAIDALTGTQGGAGSVTSGSLSLAALPTLSNESAQTTSPDAPFNQTTTAVLEGIGTGAPQLVTLTFLFAANATTVDPPGGSVQGDEAALRMGMDSGLSFFTADDYPGVGPRTMAGDGIIVRGSINVAPEPSTATLLALGLVALAVLRRPHRGRGAP
jgi:hypothetical protein